MPDDTSLAARSTQPPQDSIPQRKEHRDRLRAFVQRYVQQTGLTPPLSLAELRRHSQRVIERAGLADKFIDYAAILVNNAAWRPIVAAIPYQRRLLLLPNCLRDKVHCAGQFDAIGLLCAGCGRCLIHEVQTQAESLGYAVLVAEGSPIVMQMIESGQIEAVIGVSCMAVLEKTFPYMEAAAIPGVAIPLLYDGCVNTTLDADWLWEAIYLNAERQGRWLDIEDLRRRVQACFKPDALRGLLGPVESHVQQVGLEWLAGEGKRWRPLLTAGVYEALTDKHHDPLEGTLRQVLVAVECFHKASLIHDDIEDDDATRYGLDTLHVRYGVPIALNVGDYLLGEGYRLLAEADVPESVRTGMLRVAATGHRRLCMGQGDELAWKGFSERSVEQVLSIYERKTAPAFDVALQLGALLAGRTESLSATLAEFCRELGIAYQVQDDLDDFDASADPADLHAGRPSILWALAWQKAQPTDREHLERLRHRAMSERRVPAEAAALFERLAAWSEAMALLERHKNAALMCLERLENPALKALLRRIVCKVFNDIELLRCCNDHQASHDRHRRRGPDASG